MQRLKVLTGAAVAALMLSHLAATPALADTIEAALVRAYQNNPQLNAQRASVRVTDENVPQALSGYRPRASITASAGYQYNDALSSSGGQQVGLVGTTVPTSIGATVSQTLYNGQQTANRVRSAESNVSAAREGLRVLEQTVLLSAATIYMDYLRDAAIVEVQRSNTRVLEQTLKQTQDRFNVGEVTRTDVAQSEAQLAAGRTQQLAAESTLVTTRANFRQIIGNDPENLAAARPVDRFLPTTLVRAIDQGLIENPNVTSAMYGIDVSFLNVKVNEGALFPTLTFQGSVQQAYQSSLISPRAFTAGASGTLTVPVYQGGSEYSLIRQSKETLAQQRLNLDQVRNQARATVAQAWGQLQATKSQVISAQSQVTASETALNGVREEARVGQRTTLDVLNAQQALVNARNSLVTAQHDRVVASYSVLSAVGRLSPTTLRLGTAIYDPSVHYQQVRDSWVGVRTPDGR
ncbi:TolC family outer membrane protein [Bradyrhizobium prioriisuperbiae]|uniref:TolC family outer membrane protein n=1 Tax=Bradyrhizobium prioriisuperbiae TaxID=2854389 RepID=UPI0028E4EBDF|nr:TolC family outer membrane protein [Bradyrhizobium prioritasuperba]